jgi:uncharacterized membrane protein
MSVEWLLFLHLAGAFLYASGAVAAAALRLAALQRERPAEIAVLLRAARPLVPVLGIGLSMVVVFGIWLADREGIGLGAGWITATFVLLGWIVVVGVVAGRQDRHTRELAERLARDGNAPSTELAGRLHDPVNLTLNLSLLAATVAIVALMVWNP